jgi:hypothetical protein
MLETERHREAFEVYYQTANKSEVARQFNAGVSPLEPPIKNN